MLILISMLWMSVNPANATILNMKPGLWEVEMQIVQDGKKIDPMAEMKKMMEKMPADQRKMVMEQMGKHGAGHADSFSKVCYTEAMIKDPKTMIEENEEQDCDYKITTNTATKMATTFTCTDGSSGTTVWEAKTPISMNGHIKGNNKKGKSNEMIYTGKFLKSDCGKYKPIFK